MIRNAVNEPATTTFDVLSTRELPVLVDSIKIDCISPTATHQIDACGNITLNLRYPSSSPCHSLVPSDQAEIKFVADSSANSGAGNYGNSITIDGKSNQIYFCQSPSSDIINGLEVKFSAFDSWPKADNTSWWTMARITVVMAPLLNYTVDIEHWHRKTMFVGVNVYVDKEASTQRIEPFFQGLAYDGAMSAADTTLANAKGVTIRGGLFRVQMIDFANRFTSKKTVNVLALVGAIGGFSGLILTAATLSVFLLEAVLGISPPRELEMK